MKQGKITEAALDRSVLRQLQKQSGALTGNSREDMRQCERKAAACTEEHMRQPQETLLPMGIGEDCCALKGKDGSAFAFSAEVQAGDVPMQWGLAVHRAVNNLAAGGAHAAGILLTVLMPADAVANTHGAAPVRPDADISGDRKQNARRTSDGQDGETLLKQIIGQVTEICGALHIAVLGGDTRVSAAVGAPVITVTGVGTAGEARLHPTKAASAGDALIVTKWVGLYGTALLAQRYRKRLQNRLPRHLIDEAAGFDAYLDVTEEAQIAYAYGAHAAHDVTEGGVFGAMWQFAKAAGLGLNVDLKKLPIRQETVEVCNELDVNPYLLMSDGCLLIAAADGRAVVEALLRAGIPAVTAGYFTEGNDRIVTNGDEIRFLEPLRREELWRIFKSESRRKGK